MITVDEVQKILSENLSNFYDLLRKGELRKAGELLWGTVVVLIKFIAFEKEKVTINRHEKVREYFFRRYPHLRREFSMAEDLHRNFYNDYLEDWELEIRFNEVLKLIEFLRKEAMI